MMVMKNDDDNDEQQAVFDACYGFKDDCLRERK